MGLSDLGYLDQRGRCATPKHQIEKSVITKETTRVEKKRRGEQFRADVWTRDKKRSRASAKPLSRSGTDPHKVGEVHHVIPRSLAPERVYDVANGLLLSRFEHALAETACPNDPAHHYLDIEGPDDRSLPQTFLWRDKDGKVIKERKG